jgi:hypothetical protein
MAYRQNFLNLGIILECRNLISLLCDQPGDGSEKSRPPTEDQWCNNALPGQGYSTLHEGIDRCVQNNVSTMFSRGKQKKLGEKLVPVPLCPQTAHMESPDLNLRLCCETPVSKPLEL